MLTQQSQLALLDYQTVLESRYRKFSPVYTLSHGSGSYGYVFRVDRESHNGHVYGETLYLGELGELT